MLDFDRTLVDPSVTDEEIERALDGTPAPYDPDPDDDQDDEALIASSSFAAVVPASERQRILNARALRDNHTHVGVNRCLYVVRGPILGLPAVYPTAAIAGDHSTPFHPIKDPGNKFVPRASIGFAWNGGAGHTWLELGGGLVSTTDFHEPGYEGVALRSRMLAWCHATRWGWGESVNGFDVWPDPKKPKPPLKWTLEQKADFLKAEIADAKKHGHEKRAARLKSWRQQILARIEKHK